MEYKYEGENIDSAIAIAILENNKQNKKDRTHYREIHRRIEQSLGHPISFRQFDKHVSNMVDKGLLARYDPTKGKRGSKVSFSLTNKGDRKHNLKILGTSEIVERRKRLYQLLIFFEAYKRRPLLSDGQLARFLKQVGLSINNLEKMPDTDIPVTVFKSIKGVEIIGFLQYNPKTKSNKWWYYTVIPGFSVEEFITYLLALKNGKEPRPFSSLPSILEIPFIAYTSYTREEVSEAIESFIEDGLIRPIDPIIPGELRFNITDNAVRLLIFQVWMIHIFDYHLMIKRIMHNRPTDKDKKYLKLYLDERAAGKILAHAYHIRKSQIGKQNKNNEKQAIKELEDHRRAYIQEIKEIYKAIQGNEVVCDMIEGICESSLLSDEISQN